MYRLLEGPVSKRCPSCEKQKYATEFTFKKTGLQGYCRECRSAHRRKKCTSEYNHDRSLRKLYGITPEDYQAMLIAQDYRCKICRVHENDAPKTGGRPSLKDGSHTRVSNLHVDHNHETKKVRGLLCSNCNVAIGFAKENVNFLKQMIEYLEAFEVGIC